MFDSAIGISSASCFAILPVYTIFAGVDWFCYRLDSLAETCLMPALVHTACTTVHIQGVPGSFDNLQPQDHGVPKDADEASAKSDN